MIVFGVNLISQLNISLNLQVTTPRMSDFNSNFKRVQLCDSSRLFRMKVDWKDVVKLTIIEGANAWSAQITADEIDRQAESLEIDKQGYRRNLKDYILNPHQDISFKIVDNCLCIYRNVERLRFKYFSVPLLRLSYVNCVESILDELNEKNLLLIDKLKTAENERLKAESDKTAYESKLEEFVDLKEKNDSRMLGDFVLLVNEKKKRIQHLNDLLEAYKSKQSSSNAKTKNAKKKPAFEADFGEENHGARLEAISTSSSDSATNSDEENGADVPTPVSKSPIPGTSKDVEDDFLFDNSPPHVFLSKRVKPNYACNTDKENGKDEGKREGVFNVQKPPVDRNGPLKNKTGKEMPEEENTPELDFCTQDLLDRM